MAAMQHVVLGTAGHIDHGKTSLVRALTGIDTDRLKEEKERGITIELGFAHMTLPRGDGAAGDQVVALVDVPGHERFVRTMVAGAVGIDAVLLVVAADEGVMPQTREHIDICELLGIRAGVVAWTKCDRIAGDDDRRRMGEEELRAALQGTFLASAPIIPCSAVSGVGLDALRGALGRLVATLPGRDGDGVARLPIDRVFALRGFGTVVTGTLWAGTLRVGDDLTALPPRAQAPAQMKVRGLHVHGQAVAVAVAGQRVAVNLTVPQDALERGQVLAHPDTLVGATQFAVELQVVRAARGPLRGRSSLLFHAGTAQRLCTVTLIDRGAGSDLAPGERGLAQVRLPRDQPLPLLAGDRFVLRGFAPQDNHGTTVGGGVIVRVGATPRRGRRGGDAGAALRRRGAALAVLSRAETAEARLAATADLLRAQLADGWLEGATWAQLRRAAPVGRAVVQAALQGIVQAGDGVALGDGEPSTAADAGRAAALYCDRAAIGVVQAMAHELLLAAHARDPQGAGMPLSTLRSQLLSRCGGARGARGPVAVVDFALQRLLHAGDLVAHKDVVRLRGHQGAVDGPGDALAAQVSAMYRDAGLSPPRLADVQAQLGGGVPSTLGIASRGGGATGAAAVARAVDALCRQGTLVRIQDLIFFRAHVDALRQRLIAHLQTHREIGAPAWKELVGQSRKFAIPLAEYFDAEKVTLRVGDVRRLRGSGGR